MNKIFIFFIIIEDQIQIYEKTIDEKFKIYYIKGEEFINFKKDNPKEQFEDIRKNFLENLYCDNLEIFNINIIYHKITPEDLLKIKAILSPSNEFSDYPIENFIPLLLIRQNSIKPGEQKILSIGEKCFLVELDKNGKAMVNKTNKMPEIQMSADNFLKQSEQYGLFSLKSNFLENEIKREFKKLGIQNKLHLYEQENFKLKDELKKSEDSRKNMQKELHLYEEGNFKLNEKLIEVEKINAHLKGELKILNANIMNQIENLGSVKNRYCIECGAGNVLTDKYCKNCRSKFFQ